MNFHVPPFELGPALLNWLLIVGVGALVGLIVSFAGAFVLYGASGPSHVGQQIAEGFADFFGMSFRRVGALAMLTVREAVRRKALLVFVVFAVLLLFAGWFITKANDKAELQVKVYVSFVLTAIQWLVLPVVLLLACWGLPEDIRLRSLHTVVTKPARRNEVVLGRILGFVVVGTLVLLAMSAVGYIWLVRQVPSSARPLLVCRVPVFGSLFFKDREGNEVSKGVNVGDLWEFHSYIEGGTKSRAVWTFAGLSPDQMVEIDDPGQPGKTSERLMFESRFKAFRTYKGDMNRSLLCQLTLVNPSPASKEPLRVPLKPFEVKEFGQWVTLVDRKLTYYDETTKAPKAVDLFDDLVHEGKLIVEARCLDHSQFIGMAQPDLFLRKPDVPFASGFFKAIGGVWLMMSLVIVLGVTASCFVKGPVATILTFVMLILGSSFHSFLSQLVSGEVQGGGTIESMIRIIDHKNPMVELDPTARNRFIKNVDKVPYFGVRTVAQIIPNFNRFRMSAYVAEGFDVPFYQASPPFDSALFPAIVTLLGFFGPCLLLGYYSLKLRELEAK